MKMGLATSVVVLALLVGGSSVGREFQVDAAASKEADGTDWPLYGRTFSANHFSPLKQVNNGNVGRLGLAWSLDLPTPGSLYSSPIAVDGVLYFVQGLSVVHAVDARTGKLLWRYDPDVGEAAGAKLRGAWGQRGLAWSDGKIYTGTQDGRLIAIDAKSGKLAWSVQTTGGPDDGRYITGAPWVFRGKVVIGNGGADFAPVRGYVTAYDSKTGKKLWRFYTVPGDPAKGPDGEASDDVMAQAAATWKGDQWKAGGGGTVWNAMAYDPKFNRLYIGTGNGSPWNQRIRSPGGGDNLFLCSIVALDADTGRYVWHYQINPGETWDYNAAQDIELTDMNVNGQVRPVLLQAPKNGFFYVIDRETGKLLSAEPFVPVNWAKRIDIKTGRPVENPEARYPDERGAWVTPGAFGAHGAAPMSYNPVTGLTYIGAQEETRFYTDAGVDLQHWSATARGLYGANVGLNVDATPPSPPPPRTMHLLAWDPSKQRQAWTAPMVLSDGAGVMSTGGKLVFGGQVDGKLRAYDATTGKVLWSFDAQTGISGQPITYLVDGKQYVTVVAGYRGVIGGSPYSYRDQPRRVLTFALNGQAKLPARSPTEKQFVDDESFTLDPAKVAEGETTFALRRCNSCHGGAANSAGGGPDLRESAITLSPDATFEIVHNGAARAQGMPAFPELSQSQVEAIRQYIRAKSRQAMAAAAQPVAK